MEEDRRDKKPWEESLRDEIHNRIDERMRRRHQPGLSHLILGLAIVAVGVGLLLDNMGIYSIGNVWRYLPVILIALGLSKFMDSPVGGGKMWGGFLFLLGCGFLADNLNLFHFSFNLIWPLLIIYFGGMMLWRSLSPAGGCGWPNWNPNSGGRDPNADFNYVAVFGGGKRRIESKEFRGGSAVVIFGGYNIDLRDAGMAGETATIDVNALFGGIDIRVPDTWRVDVRASAIFGGVDDKSVPPRTTAGVTPPRLIITGFAAFGGIVVKS
ncbi:MAG: DUF5668 domain-containing protein [Bryobacteraceae bacterium]|jgi:hypothetical protein